MNSGAKGKAVPEAWSRAKPVSGFALVITIVLLGLLVLAVYALSALGRVGADISLTARAQSQARQNALLGLRVALGDLQQFAGRDEVVTGMAGITGIAAGPGNPARHWCGIWNENGQFLRWLASGANGVAIPEFTEDNSVALLANGALGADGTDKEHTRVFVVPVMINDDGGTPSRQGCYAWWVGDEGVKLSAVIGEGEGPVPGGRHAVDELIPSLAPTALNLPRALTYAQLGLVPSTPLTPGQLQANLHALSRSHGSLVAGTFRVGRLNINSTSARYWRGIAATYNRFNPAVPLVITTEAFGGRMRDAFVLTASSGKLSGGPFVTPEAFFQSPLLEQALQDSDVAPSDFRGVMEAWLASRSDTFRIRSYGAATNPAGSSQIEATAWCEAVVQRTPEATVGFGRTFEIIHFRWLGPEDI